MSSTDCNELRIKARNRTISAFDNEKENHWDGPFVFIHSTDTQFGMIERYLQKKADPGWIEEIALTTRAVEAANRLIPKPRFFVVCGDLVDALPGNSGKDAQIEDFKKVFANLDPSIPLICVSGNKDVGNTPTPETICEFREKFGDDYFAFVCGGVKFIVLNSQYYKDPSQVAELAAEQDEWLDAELKGAKGWFKYIVIFQHIPWFLKFPDEEKEHCNLEKEIRMKMLRKFKDFGVNGIFCGHYHRNGGGFYGNVELVVSSAVGGQLGEDQSGMRVVRVLENGIQHDYYDFEHVPSNITI